ncbi:hypothetical protein [Chryseobacterium indologenes]|uniref:Uncharacterized protein n=1 Tax=Chryseobacterium indologenes TaxID=253 RepID=A0A0N0ZWP5_CHRID|nr:hypothetical protein [Chryseobacterium indologenes]KPE51017.1 hypothetical protein AOB46_12585 [Chryseobacterium indologenes]
MKTLNKYQISWVILTPKKGNATKRDQKIFNSVDPLFCFSIGAFNQNLQAHFSTKEKAQQAVKSLKKANKDYTATIITDAQFGNIEIDYKTKTVKIAYTEKQLTESILI